MHFVFAFFQVTDTLRNRFGLLNGYIGSDNSNVEGLAFDYVGFADDANDSAILAMNTGIDQDMPGSLLQNIVFLPTVL